jgi:uncharacterized protein YceK
MVRLGTTLFLAVAVSAVLSGCGTCVNLLPTGRYMHVQWTDQPRKVYGGVRWDVNTVWTGIANPPKVEGAGDLACRTGLGAYLIAVDLPLSAIMDTLTLYITVPNTYRRLTEGPPQPAAPAKEDGSDAGNRAVQSGS